MKNINIDFTELKVFGIMLSLIFMAHCASPDVEKDNVNWDSIYKAQNDSIKASIMAPESEDTTGTDSLK